MDTINKLAIVIAVIVFLWAIYVAFWGGERYMRWYLRYMREGDYDLGKFKMIHIPFLFIGAVCFLLFSLNVKTFVPLFIIFIAIIIQWYLIVKFGKKQG